MSYARTYTIDDSPTGDTIKAAIVDKIDKDLTSAVGFVNTHEALTETHGATGAVVGTTNVQTLTNKTINGATLSGTITGTTATLTGCTVSGTISGGTFAGTTLSGVTTAAGIVNSGTVTGGILNAITLTGTITASAATLVGFASETAGVVKMFAGETAPTGYLECNGAAVSRTTYSDLFTAIGELHGQGDNSTTFNLPDLRGYFVRGWDHGATNDPDVATRAAAATGGSEGDHVGTVQTPTISSHLHAVSITSGGQSVNHKHGYTKPGAGSTVSAQSADVSVSQVGGADITDNANSDHTHAVAGDTAATGNAANDTRPKNKTLMYIIKT